MGGEALLPNQTRRDGGRDESGELEAAVGGAGGGASDEEPKPIGREVLEAHELFCEMLELVTEERGASTESPVARGAPLPPPLQCWSECARYATFSPLLFSPLLSAPASCSSLMQFDENTRIYGEKTSVSRRERTLALLICCDRLCLMVAPAAPEARSGPRRRGSGRTLWQLAYLLGFVRKEARFSAAKHTHPRGLQLVCIRVL